MVRIPVTLLALGTLAIALMPPAQAAPCTLCSIPLCADPQFEITWFTVAEPAGTRWASDGTLHAYGTAYKYGVWADNRGGVAAACVKLDSSYAYDSCLTCIAVA